MTKDTLTIRFFRGESEIGEASLVDGQTILEAAEDAGVNIPRNCTSGTLSLIHISEPTRPY